MGVGHNIAVFTDNDSRSFHGGIISRLGTLVIHTDSHNRRGFFLINFRRAEGFASAVQFLLVSRVNPPQLGSVTGSVGASASGPEEEAEGLLEEGT